IDWSPVLIHRLEQVEMERRHVTGEELEKIGNDFNRFLGEYMRMYKELEHYKSLLTRMIVKNKK
ncbi:MAG TPA: hypothetical protein VLB84_06365, partial [Bacteroidia bacterium]|nr:hypothetical protein [Bacteroidia bacterium]